MKQSVQDKINYILASSKINADKHNDVQSPNDFLLNEDNLLKAIRTKEDANIFIAELNAVIKIGQSV
jgi:hypothetical protein